MSTETSAAAHLVRPVAVWREAAAPAPAQGDRPVPTADGHPLAVEDGGGPADQQRPVGAHGDGHVRSGQFGRVAARGGVHASGLPATTEDVPLERPTAMPMPSARGPVSAVLLDILGGAAQTSELMPAVQAHPDGADVLYDDDVQLTLTLLYELHLQGLAGVSDDLEWDVDLLAARAVLEARFERALRARFDTGGPAPQDISATLVELTSAEGGPGLSRYLAREGTLEQWREFLAHRAVYHLREADLHTFGIPRLAGVPKAALVEVQSDEYGQGRLERMHSSLFARSMRAVGLDDSYGRYVDAVPAITLASLNVMSLFGLHRRFIGALVGHLCGIEMTSSAPNKLYGNGLRRLGFDRQATLFFDEHVEADAVHEQIVGRELAGGLVAQQPARSRDVVFGVAVCLGVDELVGEHLMTSWSSGTSSLRTV